MAALQTHRGAEPIAGYQLVLRLGSGGYGEVWKATAPGGLSKAVKIVYGRIGENRAEQELKALRRIQEVRHPFLLSLERYEIVDGQLIIVTELADMSLQDRFEECTRTGQKGIPREELLAHLHDAADALDYMGSHYGLQHLDIKPQNLLLVGGRIKVADFGLVKDLQGTSVSNTGGVTPHYATPEAFDGRVSRFSDQYSLAIVYQEMLSGERPFSGTTAFQLAMMHTTSPPFLEPLPEADRPIVERALAKLPENRFPNCRELIERLMGVEPSSPAPVVPAPKASPRRRQQADKEAATIAQAIRTPSVPDEEVLAEVPPGDIEPEEEGADSDSTISQPLSDTPISSGPTSGLQPRPTLFLGIGGIAGFTLRHLRQQLVGKFGSLTAVPFVRLLLLDSDPQALATVQQGDAAAALTSAETLLLPLHGPDYYRSKSKHLLRWLNRRWLYGVPRSQRTEGLRPLGRLALVDNAAEALSRLRAELTALTAPEARAAAHEAGMDPAPRIWVIASISGGTGGGMLLDTAYAIKQILQEMQLPADDVCALMVHATSPKLASKELARCNAYATLHELSHFSRRDSRYPGDLSAGICAFPAEAAPFRDAYLVHLGDDLGEPELEAASSVLADYLLLDVQTEVGSALDHYRQTTRQVRRNQSGITTLRTFGLCGLSFPRQRLAQLAAPLLCRSTVESWHRAPGTRQAEIQTTATQKLKELGFSQEAITSGFHAAAHAAFGEDPQAFFEKMATNCCSAEPTLAARQPPADVLNQVDSFLAWQQPHSPEAEPAAQSLASAMHERIAMRGAGLGEALVDWLRLSIEDPRVRLGGVALATQALLRHLAAAGRDLDRELSELRHHCDRQRRHLATGEVANQGSGVRWLGSGRPQAAPSQIKQKLLDYCWLKLTAVALEGTQHVLASVSEQVTAFLHDLESARQELQSYEVMFQPPGEAADLSVGVECVAGHILDLLPRGTHDFADAAEKIVEELDPKIRLQFDETIQAEVLKARGGLCGLIAGGTDRETWKLEMETKARTALLGATADLNVAQLFFESWDDPAQAEEELAAHLKACAPRLGGSTVDQPLFLALPRGAAAQRIRDIVARACPDTPITVVESAADVIACHEAARLPIYPTMAALLENPGSYAEVARRVMTRSDVTWCRFDSEVSLAR
jgi:serine/threonine protein kinase